MKKFPVLILTIILIVSVLPVAKGSDVQNGSFFDLMVEMFENVKDLPPTQYRYNAKDNQGIGLDTIKIIQISERVYLGVYHYNMSYLYPERGVENVVRLANSTDLLHWNFVKILEQNASQPTIAKAPNEAYIIAFEKEESSSHLKIHYYSNLSVLIYGSPSFTIDLPRTLSPEHEGTPNFFNITVTDNVLKACIGFHYDNTTANADEVAVGWLTVPLDNPSDYIWEPELLKDYNNKLRNLGVKGNIGDRDYGQIFGRTFTLQEGCVAERNGHWDDFRIFLYDHSTETFYKLNITTHKGSISIANPTFTWLKSPNGKNCLVVTYFLHNYNGSAKNGEGGELIFYKEFETKDFHVEYGSDTYPVYVTSNSTIYTGFDLYCAVYPYSYKGIEWSRNLNKSDFVKQLQKVREIGFSGVSLHNVECFYTDDDNLRWVMNETDSLGLKVVIHVDYFNISYYLEGNPEGDRNPWNETIGFLTNTEDLNYFNEYLTNVSKMVKNYQNFEGWIVYYPFDSKNFSYWYNQSSNSEYKQNMQSMIDAIREYDNHTIYLGTMLWQPYNQLLWNAYDRLPKDLNGTNGFAIQPYNIVPEDIGKENISDLYDYWKKYSDNVAIGEFGYWTRADNITHGNATSEESKANMIIEFLNYTKALDHREFVCYFGLTDFPPENADFGIIYDNYTLKKSGEAFKEWIENQGFSFNETEKSININVKGPEGSKGFLIAELPNNLTHDLWKGDYTVLIDNKPCQFENWTDATNTYIYVTYTHHEHKVTIIPEYPSFLILLLTLIIGTLYCRLHLKRKQSKRQESALGGFQVRNSYHKNNNWVCRMFKRRKRVSSWEHVTLIKGG